MTKEWKAALKRAAEIVLEERDKLRQEARQAKYLEERVVKMACMSSLESAAARIKKEACRR